MSKRTNLQLHERLISRIQHQPDHIEVLDCGKDVGERVVLTYYPNPKHNHDDQASRALQYQAYKTKKDSRCGVCGKLLSPKALYCMKHTRRSNSKEGA